MAVEIGVFRLIREALYFWSTITATTSKSCGSFKLTCQLFTHFVKIVDFGPKTLIMTKNDLFIAINKEKKH